MLDYINIKLIDADPQQIADCLNFTLEVEEQTGAIAKRKYAHYKGLDVCIYESGSIFIKGSIHKFYNELVGEKAPNAKLRKDKGFNGNLFTLSELRKAVKHLQELFKCEPQQFVFNSLEVGVNIETSFCPETFIKGLLYVNATPFEFKYQRNYAQIDFQKYRLKIYNKSKQYGMKNNVLRFETRIKRTEILNELGLYTFLDLTPVVFNNCKKYLLERLNEVVYYDYTISYKGLNEKQIITLERYTNPHFWTGNGITRKTRNYHKQKLQNYINDRSMNLKAIIGVQIDRLFEVIIKPKFGHITPESLLKFGHITPDFFNLKKMFFGHITPLSISVQCPKLFFTGKIKTSNKKDKVCLVTGLSLELEKSDAKYIRTSTLKWLRENQPLKYSELCSELLPNTGYVPMRESNVIDHLAKQVRNRYYNSFKSKRERKEFKNTFSVSFILIVIVKVKCIQDTNKGNII